MDAGLTIPEPCRADGIRRATFYRWRKSTHDLGLLSYGRCDNSMKRIESSSLPEGAGVMPFGSGAWCHCLLASAGCVEQS